MRKIIAILALGMMVMPSFGQNKAFNVKKCEKWQTAQFDASNWFKTNQPNRDAEKGSKKFMSDPKNWRGDVHKARRKLYSCPDDL